ncbi:MAG: amino acid racemase [Ferruginibacter sp.]
MKTIGLIGGTTWHSTIDYYRYLNELTNIKYGSDHSAKIILNSVDYGEIVPLTKAGDWNSIAAIMTKSARNIELAGADCVLLCANTMHHRAEEVQAAVNIPLIHIADTVVEEIKKKDIHTVALLGTKYTMLLPFYRNKLEAAGIKFLVPSADDIEYLNDAIYNEMGKGIFNDDTRKKIIEIITDLQHEGAAGAILGCTELPILIKPEHIAVQLFDTTFIHCQAAMHFVSDKA